MPASRAWAMASPRSAASVSSRPEIAMRRRPPGNRPATSTRPRRTASAAGFHRALGMGARLLVADRATSDRGWFPGLVTPFGTRVKIRPNTTFSVELVTQCGYCGPKGVSIEGHGDGQETWVLRRVGNGKPTRDGGADGGSAGGAARGRHLFRACFGDRL